MSFYAVTLLRALIHDMPWYDCDNFNHRKADWHGEQGICGPYARFHAAHQQAIQLLEELDTKKPVEHI
jgi:hypothetical protein